MGLVHDALVAAVHEALQRDHELELTREGRVVLGNVFLDLAIRLQRCGRMDATELLDLARDLQRGRI